MIAATATTLPTTIPAIAPLESELEELCPLLLAGEAELDVVAREDEVVGVCADVLVTATAKDEASNLSVGAVGLCVDND